MLKVIYSYANGNQRALVKGKGWTEVKNINDLDEVKCSKNKFVPDFGIQEKNVWRAWFLLPMIRDSIY